MAMPRTLTLQGFEEALGPKGVPAGEPQLTVECNSAAFARSQLPCILQAHQRWGQVLAIRLHAGQEIWRLALQVTWPLPVLEKGLFGRRGYLWCGCESSSDARMRTRTMLSSRHSAVR
jgi:hypothetical protein